ncbi:MAG: 50S ribosomal protein L19e [Nanoarchaeota archaeon]
MNLKKKKTLAAKTLGVGKERIVFLEPRLDEIKEAITKQDIRDLYKEGAIIIKTIKGRITKKKNKSRRGYGKVKINVNKRKKNYVVLTRKFRGMVKDLLNKGIISKQDFVELRKKIKNKQFKSKSHFKEQLKIKEY